MSIQETILTHWEEIVLPLVEGAEVRGPELVARNPRRSDSNPGSFRINLESGKWADFALEDAKGRSPISFIGYVRGCTRSQARYWAETKIKELGIDGTDLSGEDKPRGNGEAPESGAILPVPEGAGHLGTPDRFGYPSKEWRYRDADGAVLCIVRRYDTEGGKEVRSWTYRTPGQWEPKKPPKPWSLYNLDKITDDSEAPVFIAEGEKAADAAGKLGGIGTTVLNGSSGAKNSDLSPLADRDVTLFPDADDPGKKYVQDLISVLRGKARSLFILDVWSLGWVDGEDIADHPELTPEDLDAHTVPVEDFLEDHPEDREKVELKQGLEAIQEKVEALAKLDPMEYELRRAKAAEELGVRTSVLDSWVYRKRAELFPEESDLQGQRLVLEDPKPWEEPVGGAALAREIKETFLRYIVLPPGAADALTLWTFHSHAFEAADYSPHMLLVSPVKRSGKSTALHVLKELCSKSLSVEHCSVAALFRSVEMAQPCLLLDEADTYMGQDDLLRGLLNSSFERGGGVLRVEGDDREPRFFPTFTPTALAAIKDLPGTIMDRAIVIRMKRKVQAEGVAKFRRPARAKCHNLKRKLVRWARDNQEALPALSPTLPDSLNDRELDFWEPLFQIAALLGPEWEKQAFRISGTLRGEEAADRADHGLDLLMDLRSLVLPLGVAKFTSEWLRYELGALEGRPWATFTDRGLISQLDIAKQLHPFGIKPKQLRVGADTAKRPEQTKENYKGYRVSWFFDPWERYFSDNAQCVKEGTHTLPSPLEPSTSSTSSTSSTGATGATGATASNHRAGRADTAEGVDDAEGVDAVDTSQGPGGVGVPAITHLRITHPVTGEEVPVQYLTDPEEARAELTALVEKKILLGADTETTRLDPRDAGLRLFQITDGEKVLVLDLGKMGVPALDALEPIEGAELVFHNVQFDLGFLLENGVRLSDTHCTQLAIAAYTHDPWVSLEKGCKAYLGIEVSKEEQTSDWSRPDLTQEQVEYAARDALLVRELYRVLVARMKNRRLLRGFKLVRSCIPAIGDAIRRGVLLDREAHGTLVQEWTRKRSAAVVELREVIGSDLNPESGKQLAGWLQENLEAGTRASWPTTPKGQLSTDKDTLESFADVELVQPLLAYRRLSHRLKTWGTVYQRHMGPDDRIHPGFLLLGARTGRMSCRNPNVQNLPRDPALRSCFIAPDGYVLLAADYTQIELRIAGLLSRDPVILSAYREGHDLHREIVARITGRPAAEITGEERKLGKALNFGLLYGAGPRTFQVRAKTDYHMVIPLEDAKRFKAIFDQTYARLRWWQMENQRAGQQTGCIKTPGGRRVSFRDPQDCYTDSRNYPIQAAAADLQLLAIARVHGAIQETQPPAHLVNFVHDELVLEVREDAVEEVSSLLVSEMTRAFLELFKAHDPEPLSSGLVEVGKGPNYAEAK